MTESVFQKACKRILNEHGHYCVTIHGDGWGNLGTPDLIACVEGKFVTFELKVGKNQLSSAQVIHKKRILGSGGLHFSPRSLKEFEECLRKAVEGGDNQTE